MIRFFIDTETNGFSGEVLSLALVREDGRSMYLVDSETIDRLRHAGELDPWVIEYVLPHLDSAPYVAVHDWPKRDWPKVIGEFLYQDTSAPVQVFADFPLDIAALLQLMMDGSDKTVPMPHQTHYTVLRRLCPPVWPTTLGGAVQHNAWWDAMALRQWFLETQS